MSSVLKEGPDPLVNLAIDTKVVELVEESGMRNLITLDKSFRFVILRVAELQCLSLNVSEGSKRSLYLAVMICQHLCCLNSVYHQNISGNLFNLFLHYVFKCI